MFQYIIDYICIHKDIDPDAELVDKIKAFTIEIDVTNYQNLKKIVFSKLVIAINQNSKLSVNQSFYYEVN